LAYSSAKPFPMTPTQFTGMTIMEVVEWKMEEAGGAMVIMGLAMWR
jgi:hypothetical protein